MSTAKTKNNSLEHEIKYALFKNFLAILPFVYLFAFLLHMRNIDCFPVKNSIIHTWQKIYFLPPKSHYTITRFAIYVENSNT